MNCSNNADKNTEMAPSGADVSAVLACEAGVPFQPPLSDASGIDPIAEWLSLMEVVQMLCPVWPVRDTPMQGEHWRL
jgi:hypothetical protein